jgi:hypothetical protein
MEAGHLVFVFVNRLADRVLGELILAPTHATAVTGEIPVRIHFTKTRGTVRRAVTSISMIALDISVISQT